MEPTKNKKSNINRVEMVSEDRTKYFGEITSQTKQNRIEPESEKTDLNINVPKNLNTPLTISKKNIDEYQQGNHQEYKGDARKLLFAVLFLIAAGAAGGGIYYFRDKISIKIPKAAKAESKEIKGLVNGDSKTVVSQINGKITEMNLGKGKESSIDKKCLYSGNNRRNKSCTCDYKENSGINREKNIFQGNTYSRGKI